MSYKEALEAAGAVVVDFKDFGDYQGTWVAVVDYQGEMLAVKGSFGSCEGCDAFQDEMGSIFSDDPEYPEKLASFGKGYLDTRQDPFDLMDAYRKEAEWDMDADGIVRFLECHFGVPQLAAKALRDKGWN